MYSRGENEEEEIEVLGMYLDILWKKYTTENMTTSSICLHDATIISDKLILTRTLDWDETGRVVKTSVK